MTFTIDELFTPAQSGVSLDPTATPDDGTWLATLLANAATLQLPTTAWQPGGPERTILAVDAVVMSQEDGIVSQLAQGRFLDFAATGTVTVVGVTGESVTRPVSPDPSVPGQNPDGKPTWLDVLASSNYNVTREAAKYATGTFAIANTQGVTQGPFGQGTYHVANPSTGASYSNSASLTIAAANFVGGGISTASNATPVTITTASAHGRASGDVVKIVGVTGNAGALGFWEITVLSATTFSLNGSVGTGSGTGGTVNVCTTGTFAADVAGTSGSTAANTVTETVTSLTGVTATNLQAMFGANWESNTALAARCRLKLQALSPNGPRGAYEYFALTAIEVLAAETPAVILSQAITRALVQSNATTGVVTLTVANADGDVAGVVGLAVTGATNASPIEITTASAHGLLTGNYVTVSGVLGNTAANGTFTITHTASDKFTLDGSIGNAAYTAGGLVNGGDLGQVDRVIQENVVPDSVTAITDSATAFDVPIVATVTVSQANTRTYSAAVQLALSAYFAALPIGGISGKVIYNDIIGILYAAGVLVAGQQSVVQTISGVTVDGGSADLTYPGPQYVASLITTPSVTVVGV